MFVFVCFILTIVTNTAHSSPTYQNQTTLGSNLSYPHPPRSPSPVPPYPSSHNSLSSSSSFSSLPFPPSLSSSFSASSSTNAARQQSPTPHSPTTTTTTNHSSPTRVHRQPILESLFNSDQTFDDLKRTITNTIKNAVPSSSLSPIPLTPNIPRSVSPPLPSEKNYQKSPTRNSGTFGASSDGNFTEISTSSTSSTSSSGSQIKTVKTLVSKFTTQLQTAASSKNANEFIDLLARFSTEYASVMRNEETAQNTPVILSTTPPPPFQQQQQQQQQQQINSPTQQLEQQNSPSPTSLHKHNFFATEPTAFSPTPDIKSINNKANENIQMLREMQDMAIAIKSKARNQNVERDNKILRVTEDILTVLKAQYETDMQAIQEQSAASLQHTQDQHMSDLRSTIDRYERKIREMAIQNDATIQQYRERMMSGAGSSDEIRRENSQLRAQVGALQAEVRSLEAKITASEEERKEKRRQDLMRGNTNDNNNNEALIQQIRQLESEVLQLRANRGDDKGREKEREEWEARVRAMKEAHKVEIERKEKEYTNKLQELESMNKALRSSIQQMHQMHRKG